jgi:hypothetical protein
MRPSLMQNARRSFHHRLCQIKILLFISSVGNFYLSHSHTFCNVSKLSYSAANWQTAFPILSVPNNNLLLNSSVVKFSSAHFPTYCNVFKMPYYTPKCKAVFPSLSVPSNNLLYIPLLNFS